jgi:cell division transport system permease protein
MKRPIKTGFIYVRRAPYQAISVVLVMAITFFVATMIGLLVYGSTKLLVYFETRPQIIAFLKTDATQSQIGALQDTYKEDSRVRDVKLVSKEDAFNLYKSATSNNPLLGELVSPSIFPASLELSVSDLSYADTIVSELKTKDGVDTVGFTASVGGQDQLSSVINRLKDITKTVRIAGIGAVIVLLVTSFFVLLVVMSMRISMRKNEIESLRMLGASGAFIRNPILVEASIYSVLGVLSGWFAASLVIMYSSPRLLNYFGTIEVLPHSLQGLLTILGVILGVELIVGLIIAFFGAVGAVSRSLRMIQ